MRKILIAMSFLAPSMAIAQPYSQSMAECAAVYQNAAQWVETDKEADTLMGSAIRWAAAAVKQAQAEGTEATEDSMWKIIDRKTVTWENKGHRVFFSQEYRDWTQFCRSFAKDRQISIKD